MKIRANRISIEIEDSHPDGALDSGGTGQPQRPVVLLIMGLGMQLTSWPPELVDALIGAGYRVIRFDNRDVGLSQHFDELGIPNLLWQGLKYKLRLPIRPAYTLQAMAGDALGVLDTLKIAQAHVVGVSMGGMIAQRLAALAPSRVLSLTSVMSSSGARYLPGATPAATRAMLGRPADGSMQAYIDQGVKLFQAIGSPGFPTPEAELRERVTAAVGRSFHPQGTMRQMVAVVADSARPQVLASITAPTLVVHGKADPLVPFACAEDTAKRIKGAKLVGIEGMGHDLPPAVVERLLLLLLAHLKALTVVRSA